jgi:tetratricopeptide (TPR) repeat protein
MCIYCGAVLSNSPSTVKGLDAAGWVHEGQRLQQQNQLDRALQSYDKALQVDPKNAAAWAGKARTLATLGERDQAVKCLDEALAIDANDGQNKALRARLVQIPQGLPPGRPFTDSIASSHGVSAREFAKRASATLSPSVVAGPSDVLASQWMCAVPPHTGWPGALREARIHVFTRDLRAFSFYHAEGDDSVPNERISDEELATWGALLQSGRARRVILGANLPWSPPFCARVEAVNARLARLGAGDAHIELIVVGN